MLTKRTSTATPTRTSAADLPPCPCDVTLVDGSTARIFSWTEGNSDAPIIGFYQRPYLGDGPRYAVPAAWRIDGSLRDHGLLCARASQRGFRIAELPPAVAAFHRELLAEERRLADPDRILATEIQKGFDEHSPEGSDGLHMGVKSRVIEVESEDGSSETVVIVAEDATPAALIEQYGHRVVSAGFLYRRHLPSGARNALAKSAGTPHKLLPSVTDRRRERLAKVRKAVKEV